MLLTPVLAKSYMSISVKWFFRNNSNVLICWSRNISYYYQCQTVVLLNVFTETVLLFSGYFVQKTAFIKVEKNIIRVFT